MRKLSRSLRDSSLEHKIAEAEEQLSVLGFLIALDGSRVE